jgi:hypothetical protein
MSDREKRTAVKLELTPDDARLVMGALNVSGMLRNTLAPVTEEQLDIGRSELKLCERVLLAMAAVEDA